MTIVTQNEVTVNGIAVSVYPWEDAALVVAEAEAFLAEDDAEFDGPDWDAIVNDPAYDRWLCEVQAGRAWSGGPVCQWSILDDYGPELYGGQNDIGYLESTQPWAF